MDNVILPLKLILFSIIGYYIARKKYNEEYFYGIINPTYALFSLISLIAPSNNIVFLFIQGLFWGLIVDAFAGVIDENLKLNLNPKIYGLLNIINALLINPAFNKIFMASSQVSVLFIFIISSSLFIIDFTLSLRRHL